MAVMMAVKKSTLEREIARMKQKGYISRTGSPRTCSQVFPVPERLRQLRITAPAYLRKRRLSIMVRWKYVVISLAFCSFFRIFVQGGDRHKRASPRVSAPPGPAHGWGGVFDW